MICYFSHLRWPTQTDSTSWREIACWSNIAPFHHIDKTILPSRIYLETCAITQPTLIGLLSLRKPGHSSLKLHYVTLNIWRNQCHTRSVSNHKPHEVQLHGPHVISSNLQRPWAQLFSSPAAPPWGKWIITWCLLKSMVYPFNACTRWVLQSYKLSL